MRTFSRAQRGLRRNLWLWPLIAAAILLVAGWTLYSTIERSMQHKLAEELNTILDADLAALDLWAKSQEATAADAAAMAPVRDAARSLIAVHAQNASAASLISAPAQADVHRLMEQSFAKRGFIGCLIVDQNGVVLASFREELIGKNVKQLYEQRGFIESALAGTPRVSRPLPSAAMLPDKKGLLKAGLPTMFAAAPIHLGDEKPAAALLLRIRPEDDFTRILNVGRIGESGETYAFDRNGLMLSSSRFNEQLKTLGLLPDTEDAASILTLQVRDPGVDLTQGQRPPPGKRPLTEMAEEATAGRDGVNVDGYRGYRGVQKVSAWRWLPKYEMGVATEVDRAKPTKRSTFSARRSASCSPC